MTTALTLPAMVPPSLQMVRILLPVLFKFGLFLGEDDHALLVLELFDQDVNFIADFDGFDVFEFAGGDDALAFVADVHQDLLGADFDDCSFDDFARGKAQVARLLQGFFHCEHNDLLTDFLCEPRGDLVSAGLSELHCLTDQTLQGNGA